VFQSIYHTAWSQFIFPLTTTRQSSREYRLHEKLYVKETDCLANRRKAAHHLLHLL
jgi:hypothetical protein